MNKTWRVLFISDNYFLVEKIKLLVAEYPACHCDFYRTDANSKSYMACPLSMSAINLKRDYAHIIGKYDVVFSIHCMQIFPRQLVEAVRCVNVHPGFNPFNRGWYPQVFGIINHMPCGATIHEIDNELDHGAIICQKEVETFPWDTSKTVYDRVLDAEIELLKENFMKIVDNKYQTITPASSGNVNKKKDFYELCEINLDKPATYGQVIDHLRALTHPPYSNAFFVTKEGKKISISVELKVIE